MNTFQLSCFTEVASTLNFSQAARNLNVSQPTVSHQIKTLEDELGCSLVSRSTRTVLLTSEGIQFLSYAGNILDLATRGSQAVAESHASEKRALRIGVHGGVEALALVPALRAFHAIMPEVTPDLRIGPHSIHIDMLESGRIDVLLEYRNPSGQPASATVFKRLVEEPPTCLCTPEHEFAGRPRVTLSDLAHVGQIAICNPYASSAAIDALQRKVLEAIEPKNVFMCSGPESAVALARAGIAVAVLPNIPDMSTEDLCASPLEGADNIVFGVRVRRGRMASALSTFVNVLAHEIERSHA